MVQSRLQSTLGPSDAAAERLRRRIALGSIAASRLHSGGGSARLAAHSGSGSALGGDSCGGTAPRIQGPAAGDSSGPAEAGSFDYWWEKASSAPGPQAYTSESQSYFAGSSARKAAAGRLAAMASRARPEPCG